VNATIARASAPMAPSQSVAHLIADEALELCLDLAMLRDKQRGTYDRHLNAQALRLQQDKQASTGVTL
jgi:hypothetical protein